MATGAAALAGATLPWNFTSNFASADPRVVLNDASRLSSTPVARHVRVTPVSLDDLVTRVRTELKDAAAAQRPFAVGVARHSMGGQSLPRDGTALTLAGGPIELDTANRTYRASAGLSWAEIIRTLDPRGFSPAVMQSNHDFGIGSTFCVNAHGWPVPYGPFGSTVRAIRMVLVDGTLVNCSRTENAELFGLAMGGYGLFGVIVELDVDMVPNLLLEPTYQRMDPDRFAEAFVRVVETDKTARMAYGRLSVSRAGFFDEALLISYRPVAQQPDRLPAATSSGAMTEIQREVYRAQIGWENAKRLRWYMESQFNPMIASSTWTRNSLMNEPVANLAGTNKRLTDILHEYFVPPDRFHDFLQACRDVIPKARAEFLNVTLRYVAADETPVLAFAPTKRIAAVMSFSQDISAEGEADMLQLTEALIERIVAIGGAFYLPYRLHARRDQVTKSYPRVAEFVAAKRRFDPNLTFRNAMWDTYFA